MGLFWTKSKSLDLNDIQKGVCKIIPSISLDIGDYSLELPLAIGSAVIYQVDRGNIHFISNFHNLSPLITKKGETLKNIFYAIITAPLNHPLVQFFFKIIHDDNIKKLEVKMSFLNILVKNM